MFFNGQAQRLLALLLVLGGTSAFIIPHPLTHRPLPRLSSTASEQQQTALDDDDQTLLEQVTKSQLAELCQQCRLSTKGTKQELLIRLRNHGREQMEREEQLRQARRLRVEQGSSEDGKERHEIIDDAEPYDLEEEDEPFFYLPIVDVVDIASTPRQKRNPPKPGVDSSVVTAPPPPPEPNADGERVVQVYSTTDQNDLTGIAAAQPGASSMGDAMTQPNTEDQPWDLNAKGAANSSEREAAKEAVTELVQTLLSMTGAPAYRDLGDDDTKSSYMRRTEFVGFNPSNVPTELLTKASSALRTGRGQILQDGLREFELNAIGQDGMNGDDKEKGGGHYQEVAKVRAFLNGFRRAEVRRIARETTALLLDRLVLEGIEGLDMTLATMSRSSDDTGEHAGELNDSLLDYLNDAIRSQEKKVDQLVAKRLNQNSPYGTGEESTDDEIDALWTVEDVDGQRVESIDPNEDRVKHALEQEQSKSSTSVMGGQAPAIPSSAPEQLLLLLTLLRERIKAEAAFAPDEKGRNLRLLAYCLRLPSDEEREKYIQKDIGNSMDVSATHF